MSEQPRHAAEPPRLLDWYLSFAKAIVAYLAGLAVIIVGLPDVTPFLPADWRPFWQVVVAVAGAIAVWWTKNKPLQ